ncbi:hypothetical protein BC777_1303 [Yoonia maricola]|uniref:UrcA family protein n=1 Tax=Yoonia maricola TaxID=420999 RepID=A0A2M8WNF2_9RHOB|nr:hypothetical protein [Yoonia maricola]PJI92452.1 hypothetical protein BC777_1303 [Yoonia maricola]
MTKFSTSLAAAMSLVIFAPAAQAYSFEPEPATATQIAVSSVQTAEGEDVCAVQITHLIADILALPGEWDTHGDTTEAALACAEE